MGKLIIYEKGDLLYIFNFHNSNSYDNYHVGTKWASDHFVVFESDEERLVVIKDLTTLIINGIKLRKRSAGDDPIRSFYTFQLVLA